MFKLTPYAVAIAVLANISTAQAAEVIPASDTAIQQIAQSHGNSPKVIKKPHKITKAEIEADRAARILRERRDHKQGDLR